MKQDPDYVVRNDKPKGLRRILGGLIRSAPFGHLIERLPAGEPLMKVASGRNSALLPLSIVKRIVEAVPARAFSPSDGCVRMDGGALIDVLEDIECEPLPLRVRYAVIDTQCVGWAASVFTFVGDITMEADEETIALANARGASTGFAAARATMQIAEHAAKVSGRPLSRAA